MGILSFLFGQPGEPQRIILLSRVNEGQSVNYVLWVDVPPALQAQYADSNIVSAYKGATNSETSALRSGAIAERSGSLNAVAGTDRKPYDEATLGEVLSKEWQRFQDEVNAGLKNGADLSIYGASWDGSSFVRPK